MRTTTLALTDRIDACLPQTQCTRCGYPRCRDYAEAIADGLADINRCPPGGDTTLHALADLLHVDVKPLDPACGAHGPRTRAVIDESACIGCRKCIDACPVDAITGAGKLMHTVIAAECNGCALCLPPCPVDCIAMIPVIAAETAPWPEYSVHDATRWRLRTEARLRRLDRRNKRPTRGTRTQAVEKKSIFPGRDLIQAEICAAVQRVKQKKARRLDPSG